MKVLTVSSATVNWPIDSWRVSFVTWRIQKMPLHISQYMNKALVSVIQLQKDMIRSCVTVTTRIDQQRASFVTWLIHEWPDGFCHSCMSLECASIHQALSQKFGYLEAWLIYVRLRHDSFAFVTWLIPAWHGSFVSGMTHVCMTCFERAAVWHVSCHSWLRHVTWEWVMSCMNPSCHTWMKLGTDECVVQ